MRAKDQGSSGSVIAPLVGLSVGLLALGGSIEIARMAEQLGPKVGDQVAFGLDTRSQIVSKEILAVARADGSACRLDIALMQKSGGSLIVEERGPGSPRLYRVHWSGRATAADGGNCGSAVDLRLNDGQLATLAEAAGGYGLTRRRLVLSTPWATAGASVP